MKKPTNEKLGLSAAILAAAFGVFIYFGIAPLYRLFCEQTGLDGTTNRADAAYAATIKDTYKPMTIRFDANHRSDLPWEFKPERPTQNITVGAKTMAIFVAKNLSNAPVTGTAAFNVTPELAGKYFTKIQCFCFTQQTLKAGEQVRMPVIYFVNPDILTDPNTKDIQEITLSYTFYPVDPDAKPS